MAGFAKSMFVDEYQVNKYKCKLCKKVVNQPMATQCCTKFNFKGSALSPLIEDWEDRIIFCRYCIEMRSIKYCPNCLSVEDFTYDCLESVDELVSRERVYCYNKKYGCSERPTLAKLNRHLAKCSHSSEKAVIKKDKKLNKLTNSIGQIKAKLDENLKLASEMEIQINNFKEEDNSTPN